MAVALTSRARTAGFRPGSLDAVNFLLSDVRGALGPYRRRSSASRPGFAQRQPRQFLTQAFDSFQAIQMSHSVLRHRGLPFIDAREQGLSGVVVSDSGPIDLVYDNSPPDGSPGVLVGFAEGDFGRSLFKLSEKARRRAVLASLETYFGSAAGSVVRYEDLVWAAQPYTLGAYGSFNPPGVITSLGAAVNGPAGKIRFAGADYSPDWPGYMEGAIRSGKAAASAIARS